MEIESPRFLDELCRQTNIRPFSHYVERDPWRLRFENVEKAFLNKKGIYCFWWSGPKDKLMHKDNKLNHKGYDYTLNEQVMFEHGMVPLYVGQTAKAAKRVGNRLEGRLVDRLLRFPKVFREYKRRDRFELCKVKTGTCGNFDLFNFPERIREAIAVELGNADLTLEEAELQFILHPQLVTKFQADYFDLFFSHYSIAFVEFEDEVEMFYAEALAIGLLRPWLNHS